MNIFRRLLHHRSRGVNLGKYVSPKQFRMSPIDRVVDEGVLISAQSVRMAVKNRLIIGALRDGANFDIDALRDTAREHLLLIADENDENATRLKFVQSMKPKNVDERVSINDGLTFTKTGSVLGEANAIREKEHRRAPKIHRLLADALRAKADDDEFLTHQVEVAREAAWDEVGRELSKRIRTQTFVPEDKVAYAKQRPVRLHDLVDNDLAQLERDQRARNASVDRDSKATH